MLARLALELRPRDVRRGERGHRQTVLAQLLAALLGHRLVGVPRERELDGILEHDGRAIGRQMRDERRRRAEQRRERIDAGRVLALPQPFEELGVVGEILAEAVPAREPFRDLGPALDGDLAGRKDDELVERRLGPLGHRIERPDRLDVVAEELDPRGLGRGCRIHVDDPAAPRERAGLADLGHRLVAEGEEPCGGLLPRQRRADRERATALGERVGGDGPLHRGAQRCDDRERLALAKSPERKEPLVHRGRRRRPGLVRQRLALGERDDAILAEPPAQLGAPPAVWR